MNNFLSKTLDIEDRQIYNLIQQEFDRQNDGAEFIASENYASKAVLQAAGSILTNKYAEGLPGKRYYGGCHIVDKIEDTARNRVTQLFNCKYANVQPHSGSGANMASYFSLLSSGDTILGMDLSQGGHLTHGSPVSFSGKLFNVISYGLNSETELIDYDLLSKIAEQHKPKLIIAGASSYPRQINFKRFKEIADSVGAYLMADIAHVAGLVATGLHPSPFPYADIVTSTTHKTLRGPRGGIILTNSEDLFKKINFNVFPGIQGGPLEHIIAAKAVCFKEALDKSFYTYQSQVLSNCKALAKTLSSDGNNLVTGGSDNHLLMLKTDVFGITGKEAEAMLEQAGITCNKNMIPGDKRSPFVTSGIRLGTPALTSRGMKEEDLVELGSYILQVLNNKNENTNKKIKDKVKNLCQKFPIYSDL